VYTLFDLDFCRFLAGRPRERFTSFDTDAMFANSASLVRRLKTKRNYCKTIATLYDYAPKCISCSFYVNAMRCLTEGPQSEAQDQTEALVNRWPCVGFFTHSGIFYFTTLHYTSGCQGVSFFTIFPFSAPGCLARPTLSPSKHQIQ
jgi:hypothetical protein